MGGEGGGRCRVQVLDGFRSCYHLCVRVFACVNNNNSYGIALTLPCPRLPNHCGVSEAPSRHKQTHLKVGSVLRQVNDIMRLCELRLRAPRGGRREAAAVGSGG